MGCGREGDRHAAGGRATLPRDGDGQRLLESGRSDGHGEAHGMTNASFQLISRVGEVKARVRRLVEGAATTTAEAVNEGDAATRRKRLLSASTRLCGSRRVDGSTPSTSPARARGSSIRRRRRERLLRSCPKRSSKAGTWKTPDRFRRMWSMTGGT